MSTLFQDEILKIGSGRVDSRSSTPLTYDSDCSGSGVEQVPTPSRQTQDHRPYFMQIATISADSLVEWQWPPDEGDWYLLQEQIKEYLQTRNFHRRYPDIHRHPIGAEERNYLIDSGLLKEPSFSYIAILTDEVLDILKEDYPARYKTLLLVLKKRELQRKAELVFREREEADDEITTEHVSSALRDALVDDAHSFNKRLCVNRGGKYTCPSTRAVFTPRNSHYVAPPSATCRGRYPVALLPGQYTDSVPRLSSEELFTLPLNTALLQNEAPSPQTHSEPLLAEVKQTDTTTPAVPKNNVIKCGQCAKELNKSESVIKCCTCRVQYHSNCIEVSKTMMEVVKQYSWECPSCKRCSVCNASDGEENLMFCDICDRGYHTFCVNVTALPRGRWECRLCVKCSCCQATVPGDGPWRFQHNENLKFIQTMCYSCTIYFDKGWFCPVCLKVFDYDAEDNPMVCCDFCDRWIHTVCDNIDDEHYTMLGEDGSRYKCVVCRGEKEEVYDKYHKKYKCSEDDSNKENHGSE